MADPQQQTQRRQLDLAVRGGRPGGFTDVYYFLLRTSWTVVLAMIVGLFLTANLLFAVGYRYFGVNGAHSFTDAFFFSVQTLGTIGYGAMYPDNLGAHILVTVEAIFGLLSTAMITGLAFAKFSRPRARIMFSRHVVISQRDGHPTLMVRAANERRNSVVEATMRVSVIRREITPEGDDIRRIIDLPLVRGQTPAFVLTWTGMHRITPESPFWEATPEVLAQQEVQLFVTVVGLDETFAQTIHARHSYRASEILWNRKHADVILTGPDGTRIIDYTRFHDTEEAQLHLPSPGTRVAI